MSDKDTSGTITLADIVGLLKRRKLIIILITTIGTIGFFLIALIAILLPDDKTFWPNFYIPRATVLISENAEGGVLGLLKSSDLGNLGQLLQQGGGSSSVSDRARKIMFTDSFLDIIAEQFDFYNRYHLSTSEHPKTDARTRLRKNLKVAADAKSQTMSIGYKSTDKVLATDIANFVTQVLDQQFQRITIDSSRTRLLLISSKLQEVNSEMQRLQGEINAFHEQYNTFDFAASAKEQVGKIASMRAELLQKSLEIDAYTRVSGIEDPALRKLKVERDTIKATVAKLEKGYRENGIVIPAEKELPDLLVRYMRMKGDLDVQKKIFETLIQQQELAKLESDSVPPSFQIYESASIPEVKSGPSRPKLCVIVAAASLILSIAVAFLVDRYKRMMKDPITVKKLRGDVDEV